MSGVWALKPSTYIYHSEPRAKIYLLLLIYGRFCWAGKGVGILVASHIASRIIKGD